MKHSCFKKTGQNKKGAARHHAMRDLGVTLILWAYFTAGFVLFFTPFYLFYFCFSKERQNAFQSLNCRFYQLFFALCRFLIPRCKWHIQDQVKAICGAVIVCNHISYLDSILLISLYKKHSTIVKNRLFKIPLFGTMLKLSGYLPAESGQGFSHLMVTQMERLYACLAAGGNLIVFPEGTRSRNGTINKIHPGAFKIARITNAPLKVLKIEHTDRLFRPGKFRFNTCCDNKITLKLMAEFKVGASRDQILNAMLKVRTIFEFGQRVSQAQKRKGRV
jgi:1-acyl-sn-glycerol-3-phosphate acyltransferase